LETTEEPVKKPVELPSKNPKRRFQASGSRRGRYQDQPSSSVLVAPAVAAMSIQISSHADSLSMLINQIWMLNQNAGAASPSQEAYEVFADYHNDIEILMEHIDNFRMRTQEIVSYTHCLPAIALPVFTATTASP
jgi:hypothetical protein